MFCTFCYRMMMAAWPIYCIPYVRIPCRKMFATKTFSEPLAKWWGRNFHEYIFTNKSTRLQKIKMASNSEHNQWVACCAVLIVHDVQLDTWDHCWMASRKRQSVSRLVYSDGKWTSFDNVLSRLFSGMNKFSKWSERTVFHYNYSISLLCYSLL